MAELIRIDPDTVSYHAGRVDVAAGRVGTAVQAAQSMNVAGGAFGLMCAFLVAPAMATTYAATSAIVSSQKLLERSARELRGAMRDVGVYEQGVIESLNRRISALDGTVDR
ncbi:hypothetical protein [Demequina aurantiaca]|uniref:hypothetical protein n=1 Tax=Demequina aurantiaca TaxID=676200 RepID=UPI00078459B4|nr:hypothetical protein [Demequina aurantiaca]